MDNLHPYQIVGDIIFRRTGNGIRHSMRCTVVRTQAVLNGDGTVLISSVAGGLDRLRFNEWFADWQESDNLNLPDNSYQATSGRFIDVAIETVAFYGMLESGRTPSSTYVNPIDGEMSLHRESPETKHRRAYTWPFVAVLIDGIWTEPLEVNPTR